MTSSNTSGRKTVLITGGSEGIGAACVKQFLERGWNVAAVALPGSGSPECRNNFLFLEGDIRSEQTRANVVESTINRFGRIDVLVNNAAVGLYAPPSTADIGLCRRLLDLNVLAALGMAQLVIPQMRSRRAGTIVNIGSVGGYVSLPWAVMYCASKFAVHAVSDSLRRELKRDGIQVLKVCPGIVATRFRENVLGGTAPADVEAIRRIVTPEAVAKGILRGIGRRASAVYVPRIGRLFTAMDFVAPWLMDWYVARKWSR